MRVLITGATGQLGSYLCDTFASHQVLALGREACPLSDCHKLQATFQDFQPQLVLHAAAWTDVDGAEEHPHEAFLTNAIGTRFLATLAYQYNAELVYLSTDYVFSGLKNTPYSVYDAPEPQSVYGSSKLAGEGEVRALNPRHYIIRTSGLWSSRRNNFALAILERAKTGQDLYVVDDQITAPTYIPHLAQAIAELVKSNLYGTYHLASTGELSWFQFAKLLVEQGGYNAIVKPITTQDLTRPAARPAYSVLDSSPYTLVTGKRLPTVEEAIRDFFA